jgi:ABC-type enterochelin transport system substrate-binding protein
MKTRFLFTVLLVSVAVLLAATFASAATDFSGTWSLNVSKSKNIGMMSSAQITLKIKQTVNEIVVFQVSKFNGQEQTREVHYDLSGETAGNPGPMGDPSETVTKWTGSTLETIWTQNGAVAGTKIVRTETRSLSDDGKTMSDEFVRGTNPPLVLVFDKQ